MSNTLLCTKWSHPLCDQKFIIPGTATETRDIALQRMGGDPEFVPALLVPEEAHYTDEQLEKMGEFEG
jgi:hypothetical protein